MGKLRKGWQDFKKKYPDFEKTKELKADLGPQLDKFEDANAKLNSAVEQVVKMASDYDKVCQNMAVAAAGYALVVKKLAKSDKDIKSDFYKDLKWILDISEDKGLGKAVTQLQRQLEQEPD